MEGGRTRHSSYVIRKQGLLDFLSMHWINTLQGFIGISASWRHLIIRLSYFYQFFTSGLNIGMKQRTS